MYGNPWFENWKRGSALEESAAENELETAAIGEYWQQLALIHFAKKLRGPAFPVNPFQKQFIKFLRKRFVGPR